MKFNPLVSCFTSTVRPCLTIPSAPEDKRYVHVPIENMAFLTIMEGIQLGHWEKRISAIKAGSGGYEKNKIKMPCFTPSGRFRIRCDWDLILYSQIVHLDYDSIDNPIALRARFVKSPYTLAAFISPGGKGVKVFVKVNSGEDKHTEAFTQVRKVFDELAGVKSDSTARNLSRLCYVSVDPGCWINPDSEIFDVVPVRKTVVIPDSSILIGDINNTVFAWLYNLTKKGQFQGENFPDGYSKDHRNNFIFLFACNCNRYGVDRHTAQDYCQNIWVQNNEEFSIDELKRTVNSAYSYRNQYASFRLPKQLQS